MIFKELDLFKDNICAEIKIKKGLISSIGCSLKKYKSSHLFEPLTSTPTIGTKIRRKKEKIKRGKIDFFSWSKLIKETKNIIKTAREE